MCQIYSKYIIYFLYVLYEQLYILITQYDRGNSHFPEEVLHFHATCSKMVKYIDHKNTSIHITRQLLVTQLQWHWQCNGESYYIYYSPDLSWLCKSLRTCNIFVRILPTQKLLLIIYICIRDIMFLYIW